MRWLAVVVCAVVLAGVARAQVPASDLGTDDASRKARAKGEAERGKVAYNLGNWKAAESAYERSYVEWPIPEMLYNLCQARRQLSKWEEAIANCRAYLRDAVPNAENKDIRQIAANHLRNMVDQLARDRATAQQPPTDVIVPAEEESDDEGDQEATSVPSPSIDRQRAPWYSDGWAWGLAGAGVAVAAVGGGFLINAADLEDQAAAATDQQEIADLNDRASSRRFIGGGLLVVGTGVAIAGIVKFIVPNYTGGSESAAVASTHVLLGRDFVGFGGRF